MQTTGFLVMRLICSMCFISTFPKPKLFFGLGREELSITCSHRIVAIENAHAVDERGFIQLSLVVRKPVFGVSD